MKKCLLLFFICSCRLAPISIDGVVLGQVTIPGDPKQTELKAVLISGIEVDPSVIPLEESYSSLTIDELVLNLLPNADGQVGDFSFVEKLDVFAASGDSSRVLIASADQGEESSQLELVSEDIDLKPLLDENLTIEIEITGDAPLQDISFEISADFSVTLGGRLTGAH